MLYCVCRTSLFRYAVFEVKTCKDDADHYQEYFVHENTICRFHVKRLVNSVPLK